MSNAVTEQIIEREKRRKITQGENIRKAGEAVKIGLIGAKIGYCISALTEIH